MRVSVGALLGGEAGSGAEAGRSTVLTCVSVGALLGGEAGSSAEGRVAVSEPFCMVRWGSEPKNTWQHQSPPSQRGRVRILCLGLKPIRGSTRSTGYR
jgi:hypothetical protein